MYTYGYCTAPCRTHSKSSKHQQNRSFLLSFHFLIKIHMETEKKQHNQNNLEKLNDCLVKHRY